MRSLSQRSENCRFENNERTALIGHLDRVYSIESTFTRQSLECSDVWRFRNQSNSAQYLSDSAHGSSWLTAAFILVNAALGAGLLNYPVAYDRLGGVVSATIIQFVMLVMLASTMLILIYCADFNCVNTYHEVLEYMCGHKVRQLSALSIIITCFGICITFLIIIGDQFDRLFATFFGQSFCYHWYMHRIFTIVLSAIVTIWPMSYFKRLNFLKYTNLLGVFATFYIIFLNVYEYYYLDVTPGPIKTRPADIMKFLAALPVVCFAYQTHEIVVPVYACLSTRSRANFTKSTLLALSILFVVYCLSGTYGYYTFGAIVAPDVMQMYNPVDPVVSAGIIALIIKMISTYPPVIFCGRDTLVGLFCGDPEPLHFDESYNKLEYWRRVIITSAWNLLALILGLVIPNITVAIGFLGSLAACNVFVFPGLCMTSLAKRQYLIVWRDIDHSSEAPVGRTDNSIHKSMRHWYPRLLFIYGVFIITIGVIMFFIIIYQAITDLNSDTNHHNLCQ
ncbi:sodium-coupled neutral amino acid transporter 7-like [Oppia nitens]|uniref:sodium-coupled neutral amino acid transporter 7-like n=1 Tax=Oppia nitens TaxID=1686743 RepID=UPI0023DCE93F|nr:sodium-coupled neutral amino acid transporter 7-like [Oppia nitens]